LRAVFSISSARFEWRESVVGSRRFSFAELPLFAL